MNQREAKQCGFNGGRNFQAAHNRLISQSKSPENMLSQEKYNKNGEYFARQATPYIKAQDLFLQGWQEAWEEPKPAPVVEHFESRFDFCTCETCNAKRAQ